MALVFTQKIGMEIVVSHKGETMRIKVDKGQGFKKKLFFDAPLSFEIQRLRDTGNKKEVSPCGAAKEEDYNK